MQFCSRPLHYFPHLIKRQKASNIQRVVVWLILQRMRGSKNHAAIALTIRAIRAMRQGNIKSGQCPHPVIHKRLFGIIFNLFLTTMSSVITNSLKSFTWGPFGSMVFGILAPQFGSIGWPRVPNGSPGWGEDFYKNLFD